jgi:hypothetical protein
MPKGAVFLGLHSYETCPLLWSSKVCKNFGVIPEGAGQDIEIGNLLVGGEIGDGVLVFIDDAIHRFEEI